MLKTNPEELLSFLIKLLFDRDIYSEENGYIKNKGSFTSLRSRKVSFQQNGHFHRFVSSFLVGLAESNSSLVAFLKANPVTRQVIILP